MAHYQRNIRFLLFGLLPLVGFLLGWVLSQRSHAHTAATTTENPTVESATVEKVTPRLSLRPKSTAKEDVDLSLLWETWEQLERTFLHPDRMNTQEQVYGAVRGMVESLDDPYTVFMSPDESQFFDESLNGEFEGIGAEIEIRDDRLTVVTPLKGSPAEKAGLLPGDWITEVDGELIFGMGIFEVIKLIKGPQGTPVELTVNREGNVRPLTITIIRDSITLQSIEWEMKNESVAYMSIAQFGNDLEKELKEAVSEIVLEEPKGIIIDLRNNGGGVLDACVRLAREFFDQKLIVRTRGRNFGSNGDISSGRDGAFTDLPLVVLTNRGSASASEIFAGAVRDHARGVLIGERTFGKGSVQNILPLSGGATLKVTIAEWLTPRGRSIHEDGITPDIEIDITETTYSNGADPLLDRALKVLEEEYQTWVDKRVEANRLLDVLPGGENGGV